MKMEDGIAVLARPFELIFEWQCQCFCEAAGWLRTWLAIPMISRAVRSTRAVDEMASRGLLLREAT